MIIQGDCLIKLKELPDNSVDSIVTDPPYELGFMGKSWDNTGIANDKSMWAECLRVLKPGGHLMAFSGTRTYHRMASAIEDAGFEIRDMIEWVYGSGFPKSLNIGKAVDKIAPRLGQFDGFAKHLTEQIKKSGKTQKQIASLFPSKTGGVTGCVWNWANGANVPTLAQWHILKPLLNLSDDFLPLIERIEAEREYIGTKTSGIGKAFTKDGWGSGHDEVSITKGNSEWEGWGTALKPAHEPICMARKPLAEKTVAENVLKYGTGGINIDGSRVGTEERYNAPAGNKSGGNSLNMSAVGMPQDVDGTTAIGRFPANLIHDGSDEVRECFPETKATKPHGGDGGKLDTQKMGWGFKRMPCNLSDSGGNASRFFKSIIYTSKTSKSERGQGNNHPTVKPIVLMEYLIKMITPPKGTILDPFMGSGSTGVACKKNGFEFIGIELEPDYCKIAEARINGYKVKEQQLLV